MENVVMSELGRAVVVSITLLPWGLIAGTILFAVAVAAVVRARTSSCES